jgi:hypothetical protein
MDSDKIILPPNFKNSKDDDEDIDESNKDDIKIQIDSNTTQKEEWEEKTKITINDNDTNPWNYRIILLLQKIGKKAMGYRWMHDQEVQNNEGEESKYLTIEVVLTAVNDMITGSSLISLIYGINANANITVLIGLTIASLTVELVYAVIKGIRETSCFAEYATKHNYAETRFSEINLEIQNQLSLNIKDRDTDKDFLKNIIKKFNDLILIVPKITQDVRNKYIEASEDNDVYNTMLVGDYGNIQIVVDKNKKDENEADEETTEPSKNISKSQYEINRWLQNF